MYSVVEMFIEANLDLSSFSTVTDFSILHSSAALPAFALADTAKLSVSDKVKWKISDPA